MSKQVNTLKILSVKFLNLALNALVRFLSTRTTSSITVKNNK